MTKQELEDKFDECFDKNTRPTGGGYEADWTDKNSLWDDLQPNVIEYAKQEAIEFETWRRKTNIFLMDEIGQMPFGKYETPEELVNQFIQSKKTNNG